MDAAVWILTLRGPAFGRSGLDLTLEGWGLRVQGWPDGNWRAYQRDRRLKATMPSGVHECPPSCTSATCSQQRVCSQVGACLAWSSLPRTWLPPWRCSAALLWLQPAVLC